MLRTWGLGMEKEAQTQRYMIKDRSLNQGCERIGRPLKSRRARPSQLTSNTHHVSHLRPVQRQAHPVPLQAWRQAKSLRPMCRQESQMFHPRSRSFRCVDRRSLPGLDPELTGVDRSWSWCCFSRNSREEAKGAEASEETCRQLGSRGCGDFVV
jgi:hypothetical protein